MKFEQITEKIIGCSYTVHRKLGYGFLESIYEQSLLIELNKAGLKAESQVAIDVRYNGQCVGTFYADIVVEDTIILELKSVSKIITAHEVQLVNYLVATGKPVGLILNFAEQGVEIRRKVRKLPSSTQPDNPVNHVKK